MKYQNKITELGIQRSQLSKSVLSAIKDLEGMMQEANELEEEIEQTNQEDEEYEEMTANLAEIRALIQEEDQIVATKIADYWAKRPEYEAKMQHMRQANQSKKAATKLPANGTIPASNSVSVSNSTPSAEEKKEDGDNWLLWGVLGGLGILVGVNLFKNR